MISEMNRLGATIGQAGHDPDKTLEFVAIKRCKEGVVHRSLNCRKTLKFFETKRRHDQAHAAN